MHIGETLAHQITFCNDCRLFSGALLWMKFHHDKWMDCLRSEMKKWIRGTKYVHSSGRSLCLPIPNPCFVHTHFSHLFWNIIDLIKNSENKYLIPDWDATSDSDRVWNHVTPRFPILWLDRDIYTQKTHPLKLVDKTFTRPTTGKT